MNVTEKTVIIYEGHEFTPPTYGDVVGLENLLLQKQESWQQYSRQVGHLRYTWDIEPNSATDLWLRECLIAELLGLPKHWVDIGFTWDENRHQWWRHDSRKDLYAGPSFGVWSLVLNGITTRFTSEFECRAMAAQLVRERTLQ